VPKVNNKRASGLKPARVVGWFLFAHVAFAVADSCTRAQTIKLKYRDHVVVPEKHKHTHTQTEKRKAKAQGSREGAVE
jgi:cupin superfamily acireductone dioxygenase involved in methionine salvage